MKSGSVLQSIVGSDKTEPLLDQYDNEELKVIAQELIEALHARNPEEVVAALRAAFECMDAEPHEEGPHIEGD
jgi:hypothetical protein